MSLVFWTSLWPALAAALPPYWEYSTSNDTRPLHYNLTLNLEEIDRVLGRVSIKILCDRPTDIVSLHAEQIDITSVAVVKETAADRILANSWEIGRPELHYLLIKLKEPLDKGQVYIVTLWFNYQHSSTTRGLRKSPDPFLYKDESWLLTTHFQPVYARRVFPCYDLPWFNSTIDLEIFTKAYHKVVSSIPKTYSKTKYGKTTTVFSSGSQISTHQLRFMVYDPDKVVSSSSVSGRGTKNLTWKSFNKSSLIFTETDVFWMAPLTLNMPSQNMLALVESNDPTCDLSVIGEEFQDHSSYYTWEFSTLRAAVFGKEWIQKQYLAEPDSWKYAWVTRGIATYFQYLATSEQFEESEKLMEMFVVSEQMKVMADDVLPFPINIEHDAFTTSEITKKFEESYLIKVAAYTRTLHLMFGKDFFERHFNGSEPITSHEKFYKTFGDTPSSLNLPSGYKFSDVFGLWMNQSGYNVVSVKRTRNGANINLMVMSLENNVTSESWIPIRIYSHKSFGGQITEWLMPANITKSTLNIAIDPKSDWFIVNHNYLGYYRVMYDVDSWNRLLKCLSSDKRSVITPLNRAQLIDDAFTFSKHGLLDFKTTLNLMHTFKAETDIVPWIAIQEKLNYIENLLISHPDYATYLTYKRKLLDLFFKQVIQKHGIDVKNNDSQVIRSTRMFALKTACKAKIPECLQKIQAEFNKALEDQDHQIHPDLQFIVYCNGMENANESVLKKMMDRYTNTQTLAIKQVLAESLGCSRKKEVIDGVFELIKSESSPLSMQEKTKIMERLIEANSTILDLVFDFLYSNRWFMDEMISSDGIRNVLTALGDSLFTVDQFKKFDGLAEYWILKNYISKTLDFEILKSSKYKMRVNENWIVHYRDQVMNWVKNNVSKL